MSDEAISTMQNLLSGFVIDPPDSLYQEGFLDALIMFASEGLRMQNDATFGDAVAVSYGTPEAPKKERPRFLLIKGGRSDD